MMFKEIDAEELRERMSKGDNILLLDVRTDEEHEAENIPGSVHIPLHELEERIDELEQFRDRQIIIYCRSGNRSAQACMYLQLVGFEDLVNLRGGMMYWN